MKTTYYVFYTEEDGVPSVVFYDFDLKITRPTKKELALSIQPEFDKFCANLRKTGKELPEPTPLNRIEKNKYKGELAFMDLKTERKMSEKEVESALSLVNANFAIEGMIRTEEEIDRGRRFLSGKITFEEGMKEIIENFGESD